MAKSKLESKLNAVKTLCNEYIKLKYTQRSGDDLFVFCYTCGKPIMLDSNGKNRDCHCSHYWYEHQYAYTRYDEDNLRPSCYRCNRQLHGNLAVYGDKLRRELGEERFDYLNYKRNQIKKWTISELEVLQETFKSKIHLEKARLGIG